MPDVEKLMRLRRAAEVFLRKNFLAGSEETAVQRLAAIKPQPQDYAAVFGEHAPQALAHFGPMWEQATIRDISPKPGQTEVDVYIADSEMLRNDNPVSERFPGGMRKAADRFVDGQVWIRYRFHAPGESSGFTLDGLVPTEDGRFVLFPKPWRVFGR